MAIPTYDQFIEPILRFLAEHSDGARAADAHEAAAQTLGVTEAEKLEFLPSGTQPVYKNRAGWAHDRLKRAGLSSSPRRGFWKLTPEGVEYASRNRTRLSAEDVEDLAIGHTSVRLRPRSDSEMRSSTTTADASALPHTASPDERLDSAVAELTSTTAANLLEAIVNASPKFFETLVLDVLHAMGYGASRADLLHVGRSGDGGIDGIISLDRLGLEKIYVQAKRWQNDVGREQAQAFYGALAGRKANKGVLITTSDFTAQAQEYVRSTDKIVLVNGEKLASLMMEVGVGVTHRAVKIPRIDSDYFEES